MGGYTNNTETDVHTKGMELTVNREVGVFDVAYAYTYTWNDGEKLRRPEHVHDLKLGYQDFYVGANHYGAHTDTDPVTFATIDMDSVTTYSAGWSNGLVNVDLHNLSNEEYRRPAGYNQYGRSITVSLNYEF
jgi:outer membrane cobalamin receptor